MEPSDHLVLLRFQITVRGRKNEREKTEAGSASRMGDVLFEFFPFRVNSALDNNELTIHFTLSPISFSLSVFSFSLSLSLKRYILCQLNYPTHVTLFY